MNFHFHGAGTFPGITFARINYLEPWNYTKLETFRDAKYGIVFRRARRTRLLGVPFGSE